MISLEFYDVAGGKNSDPIATAVTDHAIPRPGDNLYLKRVDKILHTPPTDEEHPYWEVVAIEHWFECEPDHQRLQIQYGETHQVAVLVEKKKVGMLWAS